MPSIWDLPRYQEKQGPAMEEPRARMLEVLGLLGTPFPTSGELGTSAMYRAGRLDAMAGGPTQGQFREGVSDKTKDLALNLFGIFKGVKGATKAEKQALLKAQQMAREGADRDTIWNATMWYKGKDGKWRTEIDDSGAKFNLSDAGENPLTHGYGVQDLGPAYGEKYGLIVHPELTRSYDPLETAPRTNVKDSMTLLNTERGAFDPRTKTLTVFAPASVQQGKSTTLHELQHAIQQREGMARGGSPEAMAAEAWNTPKELQLARRIVEWSQQFPPARVEQILEQYGDPGVVKTAKTMVDKLGTETVNRLYDESLAGNAAEGYKRLLGEVDARNTQARMDMTLDQRRQFPPWSTWDVPEADQIVRVGDGPAMLRGLLGR